MLSAATCSGRFRDAASARCTTSFKAFNIDDDEASGNDEGLSAIRSAQDVNRYLFIVAFTICTEIPQQERRIEWSTNISTLFCLSQQKSLGKRSYSRGIAEQNCFAAWIDTNED